MASKEIILQWIVNKISEGNLKAIQVDKIANEIHISKKTIYRLFKNNFISTTLNLITMKNPFYVFILSLCLLVACTATKKVVYNPVGNWDYTVSNTPNGDVTGTLVLSKTGNTYKAVLQSPMGDVDLNNVKVEDNQLSGTFDMQGYELELKGSFEGENLQGTIGADGNTFPLKASRIKK